MSKYIIGGGNRLGGSTIIQGAKNSVLPILAATVMCCGECVIHNCPKISDVDTTIEILTCLGCKVKREENTLIVDSTGMNNHYIPPDLMNKLRSSVVFLGGILSRMKVAKCSYPGGCELGSRPVNLHLKAFKQMGIDVKEEDGHIYCNSENMRPGTIHLEFPSVGATENIMLAACKGKGTTTIINAAREPEIVDLQDFLNKMGAKIKGAGSSTVVIKGVSKLYPAQKRVMPDRIVAATMMCMATAVGGRLKLEDVVPSHVESVTSVLRETGADIQIGENSIYIMRNKKIKSIDGLRTMPYPGYPTDAQPQLTAVLALADGTSWVEETIFENRFKSASELCKMGADITVKDRLQIIKGVKALCGTSVYASDLRAGAAIAIAALSAEGISEIHNIHYIDRGYEDFETLIKSIGGDIKLVDT